MFKVNPVKHKIYNLTPKKKCMIVKAINFALEYLEKDNSILTSDVLNLVIKITDLSRSTIFNIWKQNKNGSIGSSCDGSNLGRKKICIDEFSQSLVRRHVFHFYNNGEYPTLTTVYTSFQEDMEQGKFPQIGRTSFYKLLLSLGFFMASEMINSFYMSDLILLLRDISI